MELGDKGLRCLTFVCCEEEEESGDVLRGVVCEGGQWSTGRGLYQAGQPVT